MLRDFFAGIAVDDIERAREFYGTTLGLDVHSLDNPMLLSLTGQDGQSLLIYERPGHVPPANTVLNFPVDDVEAEVDALIAKGIAHPGPWQAWFTDPAGNILSVVSR